MRIIAVGLLLAGCAADRTEMHVVDPTGSKVTSWQARELERTAGTLAFSCPSFVPDGALRLDLHASVVVERKPLPTQITPDGQRTLVARYCTPAPVRGPAHGVAYVPAVMHVVLPNEPVDYQDMAFSGLDGNGFITAVRATSPMPIGGRKR